jgi:hypothetical protein
LRKPFAGGRLSHTIFLEIQTDSPLLLRGVCEYRAT